MDCGSAVTRGANIYAPGLIGSSKKFTAGEKVAAYADLSGKMLKGWRQKFEGPKMFLGNGTVLRSRDELFASPVEKMRLIFFQRSEKGKIFQFFSLEFLE